MRAIYAGAESVIVATEAGSTTAAGRLIQILDSVETTSRSTNPNTSLADIFNEELALSVLEVFFLKILTGKEFGSYRSFRLDTMYSFSSGIARLRPANCGHYSRSWTRKVQSGIGGNK